jgi:CRP-like cAMP-binding protein
MNITSRDDQRRITAILQKLPLFSGLYNNELTYIRSICIPCHFPQGHTIFEEGDGSPCMYVLLSGHVDLLTQTQGRIYTLHPGEVFGEIGLVSQNKRTASAQARDDCVLLRINRDDFNLMLGKHPRVSSIILRNITMGLANHIVRMNKNAITEYLPEASVDNDFTSESEYHVHTVTRNR